MKKVSGTSAFILIAFFVMGKSGNSTLSPFTLGTVPGFHESVL